MKLFHFTILTIVMVINSISFTQEIGVLRVLDNNIFLLTNQDTVRLKDFRTVSINKNIGTPSALAVKIYKWVDSYFAGRVFRVEYIGEEQDRIKIVNMYRTYAFGDDKNVLELYLSQGYGEYTGNEKLLIEKEFSAKGNGLGIWGAENQVLSEDYSIPTHEYDIPIATYYDKKYYDQPYILLLPLSALCFGLAWDQFEGASDIQGSIDALTKVGLSSKADELKGSKTRKTIVGIIGVIAGTMTAVLAFKNVEVRSDYDSVTLGINISLDN